jgi:hypothetical protein
MEEINSVLPFDLMPVLQNYSLEFNEISRWTTTSRDRKNHPALHRKLGEFLFGFCRSNMTPALHETQMELL